MAYRKWIKKRLWFLAKQVFEGDVRNGEFVFAKVPPGYMFWTGRKEDVVRF